jgi:hypothetical protein
MHTHQAQTPASEAMCLCCVYVCVCEVFSICRCVHCVCVVYGYEEPADKSCMCIMCMCTPCSRVPLRTASSHRLLLARRGSGRKVYMYSEHMFCYICVLYAGVFLYSLAEEADKKAQAKAKAAAAPVKGCSLCVCCVLCVCMRLRVYYAYASKICICSYLRD